MPPGHNGGFKERLLLPKAGKRPHILAILWDDFGWANAGWHRRYTIGGIEVRGQKEVLTPSLDELVREGLELDRAYAYRECSPTRSAIQTGRHPTNVNAENLNMDLLNTNDPISGFSGIPRNMTGIATKLAAAGYATAYFGKWDAGMATPDHPPDGRGYQQGMWYFHHDNDYWSMAGGATCGGQHMTDLWYKAPGAPSVPGLGFNGTCRGRFPEGGRPTECAPGPKAPNIAKFWEGYEDTIFEGRILELIESHDPAVPLFLFWAPHAVHAPLQVPAAFRGKFGKGGENTGSPCSRRYTYAAMVTIADQMVGNVTRKLRKKGMWDDLLIVFMSDNGGPIVHGDAGNNYPLKGGKYSNFEGGIRVNSFVSGGFLHQSRRGARFSGLVAVWDWYSTFALLAGVDPTDQRSGAAGLPPVDAIDMSELVIGDTPLDQLRPRLELPIGAFPRSTSLKKAHKCRDIMQGSNLQGKCSTVVGVIVDDGERLWKLITGPEHQYIDMGPSTPNETATAEPGDEKYTKDCGYGCLFELNSDPAESNDLAHINTDKVKRLRGKMEYYSERSFNPIRGQISEAACHAAVNFYGGFWGPFVFP